MAFSNLLDMLDDEAEGATFGDPPPMKLAPAPAATLPDRAALSPDQRLALADFAAKKPRASRVAVDEAGELEQPAPFRSLSDTIPSGEAQKADRPSAAAATDKELEDAQAKDKQEGTLSNLGTGFTRAADLIMGRENPTRIGAPTASAAKDLLARREAARQATADATQREMSDPDSPMSRRVQMLAAGMGVKGVTGMSAADFQRMQPLIEKGMSAQQAAQQIAAEKERQQLELGSREKLAGLTQAGEDRRSSAGLAASSRENALNRQNQVLLHGMDNASDLAKAQQGKGATPGAPLAPGYKLGDIPVKPEEAAKFRETYAAKQAMQKSIDELRALYNKNGTEMGGEDANRMASLVSDLKLKMKDLAKLGALSGSDLELMEGQIPDPTTFGAQIKGTFGVDQTTPKLDQLSKSIQGRVDANAQAMGAVRGGSDTGGSGTAGANQGKTLMRKQINRALGKTRLTYSDGTSEEIDGIR